MTRKLASKIRRKKSQGVDLEASLEAQSEDEKIGEEGPSGRSIEPVGGTGSNVSVGKIVHEFQIGSSAQTQVPVGAQNEYSSNSGEHYQPSEVRTPGDAAQPTPSESEMPPMIGDFNDNANALWSLHLDEAKSHDEARIHSLKDDMDSVLIFAGLFSAALTSFLIDSVSSLQVDPAQQMVYYQQQNVALLAQISTQVASRPTSFHPVHSTPTIPRF
jgi:hypothetical protein